MLDQKSRLTIRLFAYNMWLELGRHESPLLNTKRWIFLLMSKWKFGLSLVCFQNVTAECCSVKLQCFLFSADGETNGTKSLCKNFKAIMYRKRHSPRVANYSMSLLVKARGVLSHICITSRYLTTLCLELQYFSI